MKIADHVQPDERVLAQAYPSRLPLAAPAALAVVAVVLGLVVWHLLGQDWVLIPAALLLLAAGGVALKRWVQLSSRVYVVTDRRLLRLSGIWSRSSMDSYLDKINNVECRQTFLGRLLGYGDLEIDTASETGREIFPRIADPLAFKLAIDSAASAYHLTRPGAAGAFPAPAAPAGVAPSTPSAPSAPSAPSTPSTSSTPSTLSYADRIRELKKLLDDGLISPAEFEAKRKQLLDQI